MKKTVCQIWNNDLDFFQVQKNGKPDFKVISFRIIENKVKFLRIFDVPQEKIEESLVGFKLVDKELALG